MHAAGLGPLSFPGCFVRGRGIPRAPHGRRSNKEEIAWSPQRRSKANTTTSSSARARPAACWRIDFPPTPAVRVLLLEAGGMDNWILVPHPGRLSLLHRQSALGLDVQDRAGGRAQRPQPQLSARQGDRRLLRHQRHDLYARPGRRLRSLASARAFRLGLERRAAVLPASTRIISSAPATRTRSAANGASRRRACAGTSSTLSATPPSRPASSRSPTSTPATTRARAPSTSTRSAGGAGRRRAAFSSPCSAGRTCGWKPDAWWKASCSTASAPPACAGGRAAKARSARCRGEVILAAGSIGSVQILKLSGVGPGARAAGVSAFRVVLDRPGVGENLQDHLQLRLIYKVAGVKTLNETYRSRVGRARMVLDYALFRRGPLTMAPSQLGLFTRSDPVARARQYPVPRAAAVARQVRRSAARVSRLHRERVQSAAHQPRLRAAALGRSRRQAGHQAELSFDRRGSPRRRRFDPRRPQDRGAAGAREVPAGRVSARGPRSATTTPR